NWLQNVASWTRLVWTSRYTMNDSNHLRQGDDHSICDSDTALEPTLTLQAMGYLWTQDALDHLFVSLLFVHRPSLLFPSSPAPPFILPSWSVRIYCPHGSKSPELTTLFTV